MRVADRRPRGDVTVGDLAQSENLLELPKTPYPAEGTLSRQVTRDGLVSLWGNKYSVPPEQIGSTVEVLWRLGADQIHIQSPSGRLLATHQVLAPGQGRTLRLPEHARALEKVVLAAFDTRGPCKRKLNRPPSAAALKIAADIGGSPVAVNPPIDLGVYQRFIDNRKGLLQ